LPDPQTARLHQYVFFAHQATRKLRAIRIDLFHRHGAPDGSVTATQI